MIKKCVNTMRKFKSKCAPLKAPLKAQRLPPFLALAALLLVWQLARTLNVVPPFMLPGPLDVLLALIHDFPLLLRHLYITLFEAAAGLCLSITAAVVLALCMDINTHIKNALNPLLLVTQTLPAIAIAPLLVLWLGYGAAPKIALIFITCFFPMTISLVSGFAHTDKDAVRLLRSMGARRFHIYRYLKLPQALPAFFSGLRISASYSIVGAVIAEWLGGNAGLGVYMIRVRKSYSFDKMFAVIVVTALLSMALVYLVSFLEWYAMPWKRKNTGAASANT